MRVQTLLLLILIPACVIVAIVTLNWSGQVSQDDIAGLKTTSPLAPDKTKNRSEIESMTTSSTERQNSSDKQPEAEEEDPSLNYDNISENLREKSIETALQDWMKSISKDADSSTANGKRGQIGNKTEKSSNQNSGDDSSPQYGKNMGKDKQDKLQRKVKKEDSEHQQITAQVKSLLNDAKSALDQGDYTKASELLQKGFELDPNSREVLRLMANVYKKTGDYQGEIGAYTQWASNNPQDPTPHFFLAEAYRRQGNYDLANQELQQFAQMNGDKTSTYAMASSVYRQMGMKQEEGQSIANWVNLDPNSPDARLAMADYYRRNNDYNSAIDQYQTAIQLAPGNVSSYVALGSLYSRMGMYNEAEAQYQQVLQLQPDNMTTQLLLAQTYQRQGDVNSALQTYQYIAQTSKDPNQIRRAQQAIARIEQQQTTKPPKKP